MNEIERLALDVRHAFHGDTWHGGSLAEAVNDLTAAEAAARPIANAHSIWEIVLHLTAWTHEAHRRFQGNGPSAPADGDWPSMSAVSEATWKQARQALERSHHELELALLAFGEEELSTRVGGERDAPLGTGVSYGQLASGVLQHNAYHGGQIALLKKALRPD